MLAIPDDETEVFDPKDEGLTLASAAASAARRRALTSSREGAPEAPVLLLSNEGEDTTPSCGKPVTQVPLEEEEVPAKVRPEPGNYSRAL